MASKAGFPAHHPFPQGLAAQSHGGFASATALRPAGSRGVREGRVDRAPAGEFRQGSDNLCLEPIRGIRVEHTPGPAGVSGAKGSATDCHPSHSKARRLGAAAVRIWSFTTHVPAKHRFSPSCKPYHGDSGLQALLASSDVEAVLVVLPPQAQSAIIQAALRAGG